MTTKNLRRGEPYFGYMAVIMILIVLVGFGSTLLQSLAAQSSPSWIIQVHGIIFLGWFIFYFVQSRIISSKNIGVHRRLGKLSLALVVLMVVFGFLVTAGAYKNPQWHISGLSSASSSIFPASDMVFFLIAYVLGFGFRSNAKIHKRFMLLAGLLIMDPAVARFVTVAIDAPALFILVIEISLYASLLLYDWRRLGRIHWASFVGLGLYAIMTTIRMTQSGEQWWLKTASFLFS